MDLTTAIGTIFMPYYFQLDGNVNILNPNHYLHGSNLQ